MATSPAQQAFRDYKKEIHRMTEFIVKALKSGEFYTGDIVYSFYKEIEDMTIELFEENEFNMELWKGRIEQYAMDESNAVSVSFNLPQSIPNESPPEPGEGGSLDEIFGYPIVTTSECIREKGRVRGQILLTLEELAEYIAPIPESVIIGIVVIRDAYDTVKGFSVCGLSKSP